MRKVVKSRIWSISFIIIAIMAMGAICFWTVRVDPFLHYHKPNTIQYYYALSNERSMNYGIAKYFDYDGIITGTSMCQNFKTSEANAIFGGEFIKLPFAGGTFKEINDCLETALKNAPQTKIIIRGLDYSMIMDDKDRMRVDKSEYPTYLYDNNIFNDVKYFLNRDVIALQYNMEKQREEDGFQGGITSFDDYSNWMDGRKFGRNALYPEGVSIKTFPIQRSLSDDDERKVLDNVRQNITDLASKNPNTDFYFFFTPYSVKAWQNWWECGGAIEHIEAEKIAIEEIIKYENIKLFSFNCMSDITCNLNNYKDDTHYGEWINSLMLEYMHEGVSLINAENYEKYLLQEMELYRDFDYLSLNNQEDYEDDYYVAKLMKINVPDGD